MNPKDFQTEVNGPLKPEVRQRIAAVRDRLGLTWQEVGERLGFSGGFARFITIGTEQQARIRTKHVERVVRALEDMEAEARGEEPVAAEPPRSARAAEDREMLSLEEIISQLHRYGFEVSLRPLQTK